MLRRCRACAASPALTSRPAARRAARHRGRGHPRRRPARRRAGNLPLPARAHRQEARVATTQQVKVKVAIAPDAPLGEHCAARPHRDRHLRAAHVLGRRAADRRQRRSPTPISPSRRRSTLNVTVAGTIENEDVDYFVVELKKGQRITAEVEGMRLGGDDVRPVRRDPRRRSASSSPRPTTLRCSLQDPVASFIAPADGTYIVQVRDSAYGGDGDCRYRLHVGTFPRRA